MCCSVINWSLATYPLFYSSKPSDRAGNITNAILPTPTKSGVFNTSSQSNVGSLLHNVYIFRELYSFTHICNVIAISIQHLFRAETHHELQFHTI